MIIYVCSPSRGDPPHKPSKLWRNLRKAAEYCREIAEEGHVPIAPHLFFHGFLSDLREDERERGMKMGETLIGLCDEMRVCGAKPTEGMRRDIAAAERLGAPITRHDAERAKPERTRKC
jgi:hypothetical protein